MVSPEFRAQKENSKRSKKCDGWKLGSDPGFYSSIIKYGVPGIYTELPVQIIGKRSQTGAMFFSSGVSSSGLC
jgi:hypothetical protein